MPALLAALPLTVGLAHAHAPDATAEGPPAPIPAAALLDGPLPARVSMKGTFWKAEGHPVEGTEAEVELALYTVLSRAENNADRVDRAWRRNRSSLMVASGGLGFESASLVVAVAAAGGMIAGPAGAALALPIGLTGAAVALTGVAFGVRNAPLHRSVRAYNAWAEAHPEAVGLAGAPPAVDAAPAPVDAAPPAVDAAPVSADPAPAP